MWMWGIDIKCKYMLLFLLKNLARSMTSLIISRCNLSGHWPWRCCLAQHNWWVSIFTSHERHNVWNHNMTHFQAENEWYIKAPHYWFSVKRIYGWPWVPSQKDTHIECVSISWSRHHVVIDGLVQDCSISSALAMGILQSCTEPSVF